MKKMTRREDYLKLIHTLSRKGAVRGADLADGLMVRRPTVCVYLKRLADVGDIVMDEHHCVHLPREYRNTNGILLEPQRLFGFAPFDLHHFYTICFFGV